MSASGDSLSSTSADLVVEGKVVAAESVLAALGSFRPVGCVGFGDTSADDRRAVAPFAKTSRVLADLAGGHGPVLGQRIREYTRPRVLILDDGTAAWIGDKVTRPTLRVPLPVAN